MKLVNNALFAGHIGLLAESIRLGERLGIPESTVLDALTHGSATSRVLDIVAARGSVAGFIEVAGEFVEKTWQSCAASPKTSAATSAPSMTSSKPSMSAERSDMTALRFFRVRDESATVSVTVRHSIVTVPARHNLRR